MTWQIYLLASILLISFNGLFHRSLMKDDRSNPRAQTIVFLGLGGIIGIVIALMRGKLNLSIPTSLYLNFVLLILFSTPAYLLTYRAYQLIGASEVVLFLTTERLWNILGAILFLHESLTFFKVIGAIIILIGIGIALYDTRKFIFNKGILLVLLSAFLFGMSEINGYYILRRIDATNFLIYADFLPVIAIFLTQPKIITKLKYYWQKNVAAKALLLSLCDTFGSLALFLSFQAGGKASIIGPLSATRVIITVILAMILLGERNNAFNKLIGAATSVLGVIMLL